MSKWYIGGRCNGKTKRLIEKSLNDDLYIVVKDENRARTIEATARDMGVTTIYITID